MILHTVNKSIENSHSLRHCLKLARPGSGILLIEDAVYSALAIHKDLFAEYFKTHKFYLLQADTEARGISSKVLEEFELVSYDRFVELSLEYSKVMSWS